jgi:hypothetical protein
MTLQEENSNTSSPQGDAKSSSPALAVGAAAFHGGENKSLQFLVKTHGEDSDYVTGLAACCIMNAAVLQPEIYSIQVPVEKLVVCELIHDASISEHLLAFLEHRIPGLRFLCHYDLPQSISDEDDGDMLFYCKKLCMHPVCDYPEEVTLLHHHATHDRVYGSVDRLGDDQGVASGGATVENFTSGQGSIIGFDMSVVAKSLAVVSEEGESTSVDVLGHSITRGGSSAGHVDASVILERLRSLEERMCIFIGERSFVDVVNAQFSCVLACNSAAAAAALDNNGSDAESVAMPAKTVNTEKLDAEYRDCKVKIVDLGNACWTHKHFTEDIQTRQYRAPEVLLGAKYDTAADMWSFACIIFELLTGDLMFDPHAGKSWGREEDHLALMMELIGGFPSHLLNMGKHTGEYFNKRGELRHIHSLNYWPLREVLAEKYKIPEHDANDIADFLESILKVNNALQYCYWQYLMYYIRNLQKKYD